MEERKLLSKLFKTRAGFSNQVTDTTEGNGQRSRFLRLPGELRNIIYHYSIFPNISSIQVFNCTEPEFLGASLLSPSIFRVCRQVRDEALSFLCSNKRLILNDFRSLYSVADTFGDIIRSIAFLTLRLPIKSATVTNEKNLNAFFRVLTEVTALRVLRLEIYSPLHSYEYREIAGFSLQDDIAFWERLRHFVTEKGGEMEFSWCSEPLIRKVSGAQDRVGLALDQVFGAASEA